MSNYQIVMDQLNTMDEKQLLNLFLDMGNAQQVEKIATVSSHFVEESLS